MNENEQAMHEELWNQYMDLGFGVVESFVEATAEIRRQQRVQRVHFAEAGVWACAL